VAFAGGYGVNKIYGEQLYLCSYCKMGMTGKWAGYY